MGGGIAQITATAGIQVTVVEVSADACLKAQKTVEASVARVAKKKHEADAAKQKEMVNEIMSRISFTSNGDTAAAHSDLIVEAIVEKIEKKKELWSRLDGIASKDCIFASNTSSLSVNDQAFVTKRKDRFAGLHFFSPVPLMQLVEVIRGDETSASTLQQLVAYSKRVGKTPVVCQDTKGFIVNRLLIPYMLESARLVERGVASVEDVDVAMKLGAGHPMGPFRLADMVGLDTLKHIVDGWHAKYPENPAFFPSSLLDERVAAGKFGAKTKEGFFKY